jgi:hypothetical protein
MVRRWWLITAATVVTAVLTAVGKVYTGAVVAAWSRLVARLSL